MKTLAMSPLIQASELGPAMRILTLSDYTFSEPCAEFD